mmetsp:Transcript_11897/g.18366  ORF Transcript_11897/g.18366 Transcript_11897/m.18366 type:complete len:86 (+) Transcript_11897:1052-1309(+)
MPFMDGFQCAKRMRHMLRNVKEKPTIVAVTGHVEDEYQKRALESGMEQVYPKPISVDKVARLLLEKGYKIKVPNGLAKELESQKT